VPRGSAHDEGRDDFRHCMGMGEESPSEVEREQFGARLVALRAML
jgi:hypothetical protein